MKPVSRDIVVVGTSAGGLDAIRELTSSLPRDFAGALLVVIHPLSAEAATLANWLGASQHMPAHVALDGETVRPGQIYLAPDDHHMLCEAPGRIGLSSGPKVNNVRPAADVLFASAAATFRSRVIGVVLSGGDGDGASGLQRIRSNGGLCMVQAPAEADNPSMPLHALYREHPDYCLPLVGLAEVLVELVGSRPAHAVP